MDLLDETTGAAVPPPDDTLSVRVHRRLRAGALTALAVVAGIAGVVIDHARSEPRSAAAVPAGSGFTADGTYRLTASDHRFVLALRVVNVSGRTLRLSVPALHSAAMSELSTGATAWPTPPSDPAGSTTSVRAGADAAITISATLDCAAMASASMSIPVRVDGATASVEIPLIKGLSWAELAASTACAAGM